MRGHEWGGGDDGGGGGRVGAIEHGHDFGLTAQYYCPCIAHSLHRGLSGIDRQQGWGTAGQMRYGKG